MSDPDPLALTYAALKGAIGEPLSLNAPKSVDWVQVERLARELLAQSPYDLRAAAALAAAFFARRSFPGLAAGTQLLTRLLSESWDQLTPPLKRADQRLKWLNFWAEKVIQILKGLNPKSYPKWGAFRSLRRNLALLERTIDLKAPGWELKLTPITVELMARVQAARARALARLGHLVKIAAVILIATLLVAGGFLAGRTPLEPDELADFSPCEVVRARDVRTISTDQSRARHFFGHYDAVGRLVIYLNLDGSLPPAKVASDLTGPKPVTALDFPGLYVPGFGRLAIPGPGPADFLAWGSHQGFARLAINYHPSQAPNEVYAQFLCRSRSFGEEAAIRLSFAYP
ncbi:MAG: type VI secretion system ImpA family N-terminal domain-containing protein [Deltaproteobacteria bacterium]|jgi:hypothetical protein|nr:type VI secretion system ImpA family N-terminal domain-containing protein [Deltaproteobacteria bacterium]